MIQLKNQKKKNQENFENIEKNFISGEIVILFLEENIPNSAVYSRIAEDCINGNNTVKLFIDPLETNSESYNIIQVLPISIEMFESITDKPKRCHVKDSLDDWFINLCSLIEAK